MVSYLVLSIVSRFRVDVRGRLRYDTRGRVLFWERSELRVKKFGDTCGRGLISSHLTHFLKIHTCSLLQASLVQWWEHFPPTIVAWVGIPEVAPCVSRVCCSSILVHPFSILAKLLEEAGYERQQTSKMLQFVLEAPRSCTNLCFLFTNCDRIN